MTIQICCQNCGEALSHGEEWEVTVELSVPDADNVDITNHFCTHACFAEWVKQMPNENYEEGFGEYYKESSYTSGD